MSDTPPVQDEQQTRDANRKVFQVVWQKHQDSTPLEPLEAVILDVILAHPEYHAALGNPDSIDEDYSPERGDTNPYLHMGLHVALQEQLQTDRPPGIQQVYQELCRHHDDAHRLEHLMVERLAEVIWNAQREGTMPDEQAYLESLRQLR